MQLAILLAVVCALAQGEAAGSAAVGDALWRTVFALMGMLAAPLAAALGSRGLARAIGAGEEGRELALRWARLQRGSMFAWLAMVAATIYILDWPQVVRGDFGLAAWPLVDELLILAPVLLPLLLVWGATYPLERQLLSRRNGQDEFAPTLGAALGFVWLKARQNLGLVLAPAMIVVALQELAASSWAQSQFGLASSWLLVPAVGVMLVLLPVALRRLWRTSPLPAGPLRDRLRQICHQRRVSIREILVWHTHDQQLNAAVAGLVPGLRYVFLTDGLVQRLSADEVAAVLRHELGHVAGRHLLLRMLLLALPLAAYGALQACWPTLADELSGIAPTLAVSLLVPVALMAYAFLVVGRYSRWLELEADLAACRGDDGRIDGALAACYLQALSKVVGPGPESRLANWLHPPLAERLRLLTQVRADPRAADRLLRQLQWLAWGLVVCYAILAVAMVASSA